MYCTKDGFVVVETENPALVEVIQKFLVERSGNMGGKYSNLKGQLTAFSQEPEYQQRVNDKKAEIRKKLEDVGENITPSNLGHFLIAAKMEKAKLEGLIKEQNLVIESMTQELVDYLEDANFSSLKMINGVSLGIKDDVYSSVSDKPAFHAWIRETGQEDLFSVHYQTMSSMVKNRLLSGEDIPPGITPYFKQSIIVRGIKDLETGDL